MLFNIQHQRQGNISVTTILILALQILYDGLVVLQAKCPGKLHPLPAALTCEAMASSF